MPGCTFKHIAQTKPVMLRKMAKEDLDELIEIQTANVARGKRMQAYYKEHYPSEVRELKNTVICTSDDKGSNHPMSMATSARIIIQLV